MPKAKRGITTLVADIHEAYGATFETCGEIEVVSHYGRPGQTHHAIRNDVGVIECGYGAVIVEGENRVDYVGSAVTDTAPDEDGEGVYVLLLDPDGRIETKMYVYNAGECLLIFIPRDRAESLVKEWGLKTFLQHIKVRDASNEFGVFGVHGPQSAEKVTNILSRASAPKPELPFTHGSIGDELGVTVVASDNPTDEEGYDVICRAKDVGDVLDALLFYGNPSVPVGYRVWDSLTTEADTPPFESELRSNVSNITGVRNALDFDKGCFVRQELVSEIENRGRPSHRFVGFRADTLPDSGTEVSADDESVGAITRAVESPMLNVPVSFALVDYGLDTDTLRVVVDGDRVEATRESLPFVERSAVSARLPTYPDENQARCAWRLPDVSEQFLQVLVREE